MFKKIVISAFWVMSAVQLCNAMNPFPREIIEILEPQVKDIDGIPARCKALIRQLLRKGAVSGRLFTGYSVEVIRRSLLTDWDDCVICSILNENAWPGVRGIDIMHIRGRGGAIYGCISIGIGDFEAMPIARLDVFTEVIEKLKRGWCLVPTGFKSNLELPAGSWILFIKEGGSVKYEARLINHLAPKLGLEEKIICFSAQDLQGDKNTINLLVEEKSLDDFRKIFKFQIVGVPFQTKKACDDQAEEKKK
jgi:hypothetical protein